MKTILTLCFSFLVIAAGIAQSNDEKLKEIAIDIKDAGSARSIVLEMKASMDDLQKIFVSTQDVNDAWIELQYFYEDIESWSFARTEKQSEVKIHYLRGSELKGNVESEFPAEYYKIADHFKDDLSIFIIEFVEPGKESGIILGAFFFVRNHWVFVPDPYTFLG